MKKKVFAVLCTVLIVFTCVVVPVYAVTEIFTDFGDWVLDTALTQTLERWKTIYDGNKPMTKGEALAYWESIALSSNVSRSTFEAFYEDLVVLRQSDWFVLMLSLENGWYEYTYEDFYNYIYGYDSLMPSDFLEAHQTAIVRLQQIVTDYQIPGSLYHVLMFDGKTYLLTKLWGATDDYNLTTSYIADYIYGEASNTSAAPVDNPDTSITSDGNVQVSGKMFSEICAQLQEQYAPSKTEGAITYCTDTRWKSLGYANRDTCISFIYENQFCGTSSTDIYLVPFYIDANGNSYYGSHQYHVSIYLDSSSVPRLSSDVYDISTGNLICTMQNPGNYSLSTYQYADISVASLNNSAYFLPEVHYYNGYNSYIGGSYSTYKASVANGNDGAVFYSIDKLSTYNATTIYNQFKNTDPTSHGVSDCGYLYSTSYIEFQPFSDIDTTRIDPDATVTLAGDTIYDYTITNTNGDTTTINYYITNNYTIPENADDNTEEDNGNTSTSGDITVGGKVDVSGGIDVDGQVDININVNQNGGSGTGEVSAYEYEEVNLQEALEQIPEMGDGFKSWFSRMFDWLPPEILGLIIGGITLAILLRIAGR